MSYSLSRTCYNCKNQEACTDPVKVQDAINSIHDEACSPESGHMGSGEIILLCHNHDQQPQE